MTWHGLISVGFVLIGPNFIANCHSFQWGDETNKMIVFLKSPSFFLAKSVIFAIENNVIEK